MVTGILKREGFGNVETAADCRECRERCKNGMPDLIILDIGLPDGDGFSLMNEIRTGSGVPVLFLSARDEDSDRLLGLGLGADDYMTKPFLPRELVLRLTAILKRTYFPPAVAGGQREERLTLGNRIVDFAEGCVREGGKIVTFDAISQALWGDFYYGYENSLMVHVRRLREKIEENPSSPRWLLTVRGLGYKLEKEERVYG